MKDARKRNQQRKGRAVSDWKEEEANDEELNKKET